MHSKIVAALRAGNYQCVAVQFANISAGTFYRWMAMGEQQEEGSYREFYEAVKLAESEAEMRAVVTIQNCIKDGDWKAAMTYLERKYPDRWGRRERHEVSGPGGSPLELRAGLIHELMREVEKGGAFEPEIVDEDMPKIESTKEVYVTDDGNDSVDRGEESGDGEAVVDD